MLDPTTTVQEQDQKVAAPTAEELFGVPVAPDTAPPRLTDVQLQVGPEPSQITDGERYSTSI